MYHTLLVRFNLEISIGLVIKLITSSSDFKGGKY